MSYCVSHGKDKVIFVTKEDHEKPSSVVLPENNEPRGFLLPNGEINWSCPCLGNMVVGPCSVEFRESISCFHNSTTEAKGSDCLEQFREMNACMSRYPKLYKRDEETEEKLQNLEEEKKQILNSDSVEEIDVAAMDESKKSSKEH